MIAAGVLTAAALAAAVVGVTYASVEHHAPHAAPGRGAVRAAPVAVRSQPPAVGLVTTLPGPASFQNSAVIGPSWLAFSPDGTKLAYSSGVGPLLVWNLATRQSARLTIPGSGSSTPSQVAFSPDGRTLAVGGFADAYLYDAATDRLTASLDTPGGADTLAFSPNAKLLATAGSLGPVYVWDLATSSQAATLTDPGGQAVGSEAFSPDSSLLAIADSNGRTYVWDVATRAWLRP
jgi:WD40 repeat protein